MELNKVEKELRRLYDNWELGNENENSPKFSAMFRMGFPDEYIDSNKPLLMYVGQEDLDGKPHKTQAWVRKYQIVQQSKIYNEEIDRGQNTSPFWEFYRKLGNMGYNCLWNNLDKFLKSDHKTQIEVQEAIDFNAPYGEERISVLQREISLLKPNVIVFAIGPRWKYMKSLASAFSIDVSLLYSHKPTRKNCVNDISSVLCLQDTVVLWTYHPNYLSIGRLKDEALQKIEMLLKYNE